jgi:hypothetical protein
MATTRIRARRGRGREGEGRRHARTMVMGGETRNDEDQTDGEHKELLLGVSHSLCCALKGMSPNEDVKNS